MYLLNADQIRRAVEGPRGQRLDIRGFSASCLQHTSYYFRLGKFVTRLKSTGNRADAFDRVIEDLSTGNGFLNLRPREYVYVESFEQFQLDAKTLGIFGGISDITARALQLVHSPFIDPLFPGEREHGYLKLGLMNLTEADASIQYQDKIGKVSFFDVSDTYPVDLIPGSDSEMKFRERTRPATG